MSSVNLSKDEVQSIVDRAISVFELHNEKQLSEYLGISQSDKTKRKQRGTIVRLIERKAYQEGKDVSYILTGKGESLSQTADPSRRVIYTSEKKVFAVGNDSEADDDFVLIPHLSGKISAGVGLAPENEIHVRVAFRKDWIKKKGSPEQMSLIKVKGDSMEPTLSSGDMILVDHSRNTIDPQGGIYAIVIDDMIMIKRLHVLGTNRIRIVSDNPHYEPIETTADDLKINGKVLWFCRELER